MEKKYKARALITVIGLALIVWAFSMQKGMAPSASEDTFLDDATSLQKNREIDAGTRRDPQSHLPVPPEQLIAGASTPGKYYMYSQATSYAPDATTSNKGLRATFDVVKLGSGAYSKSAWIALNFPQSIDASGVTHRYWMQWGYRKHSAYGHMTLMQIWDFDHFGSPVYPPMTLLNTVPPPTIGTKVDFTMYNVPGTTKWRTARNGVDIFEVELNTDYALRPEVAIEANADRPPRMPLINFNPALQVQHADGSWVTASAADSSSSAWGIEGMLQNAALSFGELNMGNGAAKTASGVKLW